MYVIIIPPLKEEDQNLKSDDEYPSRRSVASLTKKTKKQKTKQIFTYFR